MLRIRELVERGANQTKRQRKEAKQCINYLRPHLFDPPISRFLAPDMLEIIYEYAVSPVKIIIQGLMGRHSKTYEGFCGNTLAQILTKDYNTFYSNEPAKYFQSSTQVEVFPDTILVDDIVLDRVVELY